jgi:hypothetical protein
MLRSAPPPGDRRFIAPNHASLSQLRGGRNFRSLDPNLLRADHPIQLRGPVPGGIITNRFVDQITSRNKGQFSTSALVARIAEGKAETKQREERLLQSTEKCSISQVRGYRNSLPNLKEEELKRLLTNNFYDPLLMQTVMCLSDSIIHLQTPQSGTLTANERVRYWISDLKQIGAESVEGYAMTGDLKHSSRLYVLKAPRPPADLGHELFVGMQLNQLRSIIPNYMYTYGGFSCSPPVIEKNKHVAAWCNNESRSVQYILYENIEPSIPFRKYIEACSFSSFLDKYLQILYAGQAAFNLLEFTHYDLHDENVLLRKVPEMNMGGHVYIPYPTEKGMVEYLKTDAISTVIDYGFSHVKVDNEHFGVWDFLAYGAFPDRGFPIADAYKLLLMSMRTMLEARNNDCFDGAARILRFFTNENPVSVVQSQAKTYYYLPLTPETSDRSMFDLTHYIRKIYPQETSQIIVSSPPDGTRVLGCNGTDVCYAGGDGVDQLRTVLGLNLPTVVKSTIELYDLVPRLEGEGRVEEANEVKDSFNYLDAREEDDEQIETLLEQLYARDVNITSIQGLTVRDLMDTTLIAKYRHQVEVAAHMYDLYQQLNILYAAGIYAAKMFEDDATVDYRQDSIDELKRSFVQLYDPIYQALAKDYLYLKSLHSSSKKAVEFATQRNKEVRWWWHGFPIYFDAVVAIYPLRN